jgi:hypothetical protein
VLWRYDSKARMHGFTMSGPLVLFLVEDPEGRIVALDAVRGTAAWNQTFEGTPSSRIFTAGESVVFTTQKPNRIHLFEVETGKRLLAQAPYPDGTTAQVIHVGDDVLVLHSEGRFLEAYDLPSGKLRWRQLMVRVQTRSLEPGSEGLVFLGTRRAAPGQDEKLFLETISLRTGKIVRQKQPAELGNALFMMVDGDQAVVVSREPDKSVTVRGVALDDFTVRWTTPLGANDATLLPPALTRDHVLLGAFIEDMANAKYSTAAWLLDKSGRVRHHMKGGPYDRPPAYLGVAHDRLIISVESKVDVNR